MKKSKKEQKKMVARYIQKYQEFSKLTDEELVTLQDKKMSSTDFLALRDVCQSKMKQAIMDSRIAQEAKIDITNEEQEETSKDEQEA